MKKLSTDSYKGVRDFYPEDMAIQRYMFEVWSKTAESFGFERYDASVLEPAELYRAKGVENAEMVDEQTYTFTDRGDREVTLRPEMTPTVARMIAGRARELSFPVRWYSIPNLFRYERTQRGRLREHWQLNCDIFGSDDMTADIEIIALAHQIFLNFGADESMFEIRVNDRAEMKDIFGDYGITDEETTVQILRFYDRFHKINTDEERISELTEILDSKEKAREMLEIVESQEVQSPITRGLKKLGINNVKVDRTIARGFDYYTSTVFEVFDTDPENNRAMLGGGRYDNLTAMFGGDPIPGIGFGFGDVTMRNFLETHNLLTADITAPTLMIVPTDTKLNLAGQKLAQEFRSADLSVAVDISEKKVGKKISRAVEAMCNYVLVLGEDELTTGRYTLKNLAEETELTGTIEELLEQL